MASLGKPRLSSLTRGLLVFVPVVCLGVNIALPRLPWQPQLITSLDYTATWFAGGANRDSWEPMRAALLYLDETPDGSGDRLLYEEIFFERGIKLQYPPTSLLFLDGLRRLPGRWASNDGLNAISWLAVWLTAGITAWILVVVARRHRDADPQSALDATLQAGLGLAAALTFYPLVRGFYLGQIQVWIDLLVAALVLSWVLGRPLSSGVLAGVTCAIKPQLGLLVLWAALRGRWRFVVGWSAAVGVLSVASLLAYGFATHLDYLDVLAYIGRHGEGFHPNQSLNGLLNRMLGVGNNLAWEKSLFAPFDARVYAATVATSALLIGFWLLFRRGEHGRAPTTDLSIGVVTATIASPVAWTHHYAVFLPVFAAALPATLAARGMGRFRLLGLGAAFVLIANNYRALNRLADTPFNFAQSYVFFGGLLLLAHLYWLRHAEAWGES